MKRGTGMSPAAGAPESLRQVQYAFTRHIRDPEHVPAPADIEDRRMAIYRDLLFNNVSSFLAGSFPVLRTLHADADWEALIRDYFGSHRARTPLFPKMPQEFLQYLEQERGERPADLPFLLELAHYEWVEMSLTFDPREPDAAGVDPDGDLLQGTPVMSPLAWPLSYRFPVHRIGPGYMPAAAPDQPTYLVVYRDRRDDVKFLELNAVSARLVELLSQPGTVTGRDLLLGIAAELRHPEPEVVVDGGHGILRDMRGRDILLGTTRL